MHLDHQDGPWDAWAETVNERLAWLHDAVEGVTSQVSHNARIVQEGLVLLKEQTKTYQAGLKTHLEAQVAQVFEQIQQTTRQNEKNTREKN